MGKRKIANILEMANGTEKRAAISCSDGNSKIYVVQWNLGIRDTQGTVKNCPEFGGGLISQVYFYVMNKPRD